MAKKSIAANNPSNSKSGTSEAASLGLSIRGALAESLFVLLPLIVIAIVLAVRSDIASVFHQTEWSFGATVLSGQSIIKIVLAVSRAQTPPHKINNIVLMVSGVIVLLLVPSLVVLALMLALNPIPNSLLIAQLILFILSLVTFLVFGAVAEAFQITPLKK